MPSTLAPKRPGTPRRPLYSKTVPAFHIDLPPPYRARSQEREHWHDDLSASVSAALKASPSPRLFQTSYFADYVGDYGIEEGAEAAPPLVAPPPTPDEKAQRRKEVDFRRVHFFDAAAADDEGGSELDWATETELDTETDTDGGVASGRSSEDSLRRGSEEQERERERERRDEGRKPKT